MKKLLLLVIAVASINTSFAWGPEGHMIVAQVAEDLLKPTTQKNIAKLLNNQSLAEVSNWADAVKSEPDWLHTKPWHFADIPDGGNYETMRHAPEGDVITAITAMIKVVKTKTSTLEEKQNALMFIIHFVGDMHQPLHVGRPDDHGGNLLKISFQGRNTNLHALWDSALITTQRMDYLKYARFLQGKSMINTPYDLPEISFSEIIEEDMHARTEIYNFKAKTAGTIRLENTYIQRNISTMNDRLLKGGQRLAKILNSNF
jgi:hypothetical protein